jgi:hypothetical protein
MAAVCAATTFVSNSAIALNHASWVLRVAAQLPVLSVLHTLLLLLLLCLQPLPDLLLLVVQLHSYKADTAAASAVMGPLALSCSAVTQLLYPPC